MSEIGWLVRAVVAASPWSVERGTCICHGDLIPSASYLRRKTMGAMAVPPRDGCFQFCSRAKEEGQ